MVSSHIAETCPWGSNLEQYLPTNKKQNGWIVTATDVINYRESRQKCTGVLIGRTVLWLTCPHYHTKWHTHQHHDRSGRAHIRSKRGWQPNSQKSLLDSRKMYDYSSPQLKVTHKNIMPLDWGEPLPFSFRVRSLGASSIGFNKHFSLRNCFAHSLDFYPERGKDLCTKKTLKNKKIRKNLWAFLLTQPPPLSCPRYRRQKNLL